MGLGSGGEPEEVLAEHGVTHVARVGTTVRRPARPFTATVQAYLAHVRARGFRDCPEPLGHDDAGREVLSFVPGEVPVEPLPGWATGEGVLVALARLVRRLHDAAADWTPPPGAVFGSLPGPPPPGSVPMVEVPELVSHQDCGTTRSACAPPPRSTRCSAAGGTRGLHERLPRAERWPAEEGERLAEALR